jgi:hypothetical protein
MLEVLIDLDVGVLMPCRPCFPLDALSREVEAPEPAGSAQASAAESATEARDRAMEPGSAQGESGAAAPVIEPSPEGQTR